MTKSKDVYSFTIPVSGYERFVIAADSKEEAIKLLLEAHSYDH